MEGNPEPGKPGTKQQRNKNNNIPRQRDRALLSLLSW